MLSLALRFFADALPIDFAEIFLPPRAGCARSTSFSELDSVIGGVAPIDGGGERGDMARLS